MHFRKFVWKFDLFSVDPKHRVNMGLMSARVGPHIPEGTSLVGAAVGAAPSITFHTLHPTEFQSTRRLVST